MMRSIAACMKSSRLSVTGDRSDKFGFELPDRLVGEAELVVFAALEHLDDNFEQTFIGGETVGDRTGAAEIIGGDSVGIAHDFDAHDLYSALDQHDLRPPIRSDKARYPARVPFSETDF